MENTIKNTSSSRIMIGVWTLIISFAIQMTTSILGFVPSVIHEYFETYSNALMGAHIVQFLGFIIIAFTIKDFYVRCSACIFAVGTLITNIPQLKYVIFDATQSYDVTFAVMALLVTLMYIGYGVLCCSAIIRDNLFKPLVICVGICVAISVFAGWHWPRTYVHSENSWEFFERIHGVMGMVALPLSLAYLIAEIYLWYRIGKLYSLGVAETGDVKERLIGALTSRYVLTIVALVLISKVIYMVMWNNLIG